MTEYFIRLYLNRTKLEKRKIAIVISLMCTWQLKSLAHVTQNAMKTAQRTVNLQSRRFIKVRNFVVWFVTYAQIFKEVRISDLSEINLKK